MMTVQYTATFPDGADPAPLDSYVHDFRTAMVPYWGYGAYVNYADASITNWADAYFAGNAARLGPGAGAVRPARPVHPAAVAAVSFRTARRPDSPREPWTGCARAAATG